MTTHQASRRDPVDWVDPLIDTASRRYFFFSSACRPFGMVNLSPDTVTAGAWTGGYRYDVRSICWFSHVHAWQLAGIPVLPVTGQMKGHLGAEQYKSRFSHERETVQPGYHLVVLEDYGIKAELTATDRVGFHRYTFPRTDSASILFDLGATIGPTEISDCSISRVSDTRLEGYVENDATKRRPKRTRIYFVADLSRPCTDFGGWKHGELLPSTDTTPTDTVGGEGSGAFVSFKTADGEAIMLKLAISYCSVEQAHLNLEAELAHWDFDRVREQSRSVWNNWLGRIDVQGGTDSQRTKFYTDLYHALLGRRRVSDTNGKYSDMTGEAQRIRQIPLAEEGKPRYEHHNSDAFWGAQWTINVLWPLVCPEITRNFCHTFMDMYRNGGLIPRGPSGGNYTFVMIAATSTPLFVSAYRKGIRSFDAEAAYEGMKKNHSPGGLMSKAGYEHHTCRGGGIEFYIERGFVPEGLEPESKASHLDGAGMTLEYAYHDWCLAQMADALGRMQDRSLYMKRAHNYRNLWDPDIGFMRPRNGDGSWLDDFDPKSPTGWVEASGWHYLWWVPHDVKGLVDLMGGRETFVRRLNELFEKAKAKNFVAPHGRHHENYIEYGNQPCTQSAHLFNFAGAPWLTQKWVREVMAHAKADITPYGGYGGDEDQGLMGSLNVLMALGLFQMRGGCESDPVYEITSPLFDRATIRLSSEYYRGDTFVIETVNNSEKNIYIQAAELNGAPWHRPWLRHSDIVAGGTLRIWLGPRPNTKWGSRSEDAPPSMSDEV